LLRCPSTAWQSTFEQGSVWYGPILKNTLTPGRRVACTVSCRLM
jgi:hypothetical protein